MRGLPLFALVCTLAAAPYAFPLLGIWPVLGLLALMALTPAVNPVPRRGSLREETEPSDS